MRTMGLVVIVSCRCSEAEGVVRVYCVGDQGHGRPHAEKKGGGDDAG